MNYQRVLFASRAASILKGLALTPATRLISTTAVKPDVYIGYEQLGNREIVGHGQAGEPHYVDRVDFPYPAIRFQNPDKFSALIEKEKADWKNLSMDQKKQLYRYSFCHTFVELDAPTGNWKAVTALIFAGMGITFWMYVFCKKYVYLDLPISMSEEWRHASLQRMIDLHMEPISGVASKWDYEKNDWKK